MLVSVTRRLTGIYLAAQAVANVRYNFAQAHVIITSERSGVSKELEGLDGTDVTTARNYITSLLAGYAAELRARRPLRAGIALRPCAPLAPLVFQSGANWRCLAIDQRRGRVASRTAFRIRFNIRPAIGHDSLLGAAKDPSKKSETGLGCTGLLTCVRVVAPIHGRYADGTEAS